MELISDLDNEMFKRKTFTYEMGKTAEIRKAETSFNRAKRFVREVEKMIN